MNNLYPASRNQNLAPSGGIAQHRDCLYRSALSRLRNREQAEDAVHDSFLAVLGGPRKFAGRSSERTWIIGILKHKVCDQVRRACRDRAIFDWRDATNRDEFECTNQLPGSSPSDPSTELQRKELGAAIEQALARLPERLGRAFSLYEIEDRSGREVCAALNISENNLWITLHRARKQLREQLAPWQRAAA